MGKLDEFLLEWPCFAQVACGENLKEKELSVTYVNLSQVKNYINC